MHSTTRKLIELVATGRDPASALSAVLGEQNKSTPIEHPRVVAFDLDGTLLSYDGDPSHIGKPLTGVVAELQKIKDAGWLIAIWTCRGDLEEVKTALDSYGLPYDFINENPHGPPDGSSKIFAHVYVDDRAISFDGKVAGLADRVTKFKPWYQR